MDEVFINNLDSINNNDNNNITANNNERFEVKTNPFIDAINRAGDKLSQLIKHSENIRNSDINIVAKVLDENFNVIPIFKKSKYFNNIINDIPKKNNNEKNINTRTNSNEINRSSNTNKEKKNLINNSQINCNQNNLFLERNLPNNTNNTNASRNDRCAPNINVQNIIVKFPNLNEITSRINPQNNINDNNLLLNINSNINLNNNNNNTMKFIGNKRNLDNKNAEKTEKEKIFEEIKNLFNNFKNKEKSENAIYENKSGFFEKNVTIIMNNKPFCIIYLSRSFIQNIFLVNDRSMINDDQGIIEILNNIKNDMNKKIKDNK